MNHLIPKFLAKKIPQAFIKKYPEVFKKKSNSTNFNFIHKRLWKWKADGEFFEEIVKSCQFTDFINIALLFAHKKEADFFHGLLPIPLKKKHLSAPAPESNPRVCVKVDINLLSSKIEKVNAKLPKLKNARVQGKEGLKRLIGLAKSTPGNTGYPGDTGKYQKRLNELGTMVLKVCNQVHKKNREKAFFDEIARIYTGVENYLKAEADSIKKELAGINLGMDKNPEYLANIESTYEKLNFTHEKITLAEAKNLQIRSRIEENRELNQDFIREADEFRTGFFKRQKKSGEIDHMLSNSTENFFNFSLCKGIIAKEREAILAAQKLSKILVEKYGEIEAIQKDKFIVCESTLELISGLNSTKAQCHARLLNTTDKYCSTIHSTREKITLNFLRLAKCLIVLDRFIIYNPMLKDSLFLAFSEIRKTERSLKTHQRTLSSWQSKIRGLEENEALNIPIKTETSLKGIRTDFDRCASLLPDKVEIGRLLKRNFEQEKKVNELELEGISRMMSLKGDASPGGIFSNKKIPLALNNTHPYKDTRNILRLTLRKWNKRIERSMDMNRRMEYSVSKTTLYAKRSLAVILALGGFGYLSGNLAFKVDARIMDAPSPQVNYHGMDQGEYQFLKNILKNEINTATYGPMKSLASSALVEDRKKQWKIFLPVFENFSMHWDQGDHPVLITKDKHIPDSKTLEGLQLLGKIRQRVNSHYKGFFSRLFLDFVELGIPHRDAVKSIISNEKINLTLFGEGIKAQYRGKNKLIQELEEMDFGQFVATMTPYIVKNYSAVSKNLGLEIPGNLTDYARALSEDIFFSANVFGIPLTTLVTISHQETYFMNILGDGNKSVGPFQLYEPTRRLIVKRMNKLGLKIPMNVENLQNQITFTTFMAAFHVRSLVKRYATYKNNPLTGKVESITIDLDKCLKLYNGHSAYPSRVLKKNSFLKHYLETQKVIFS